ncbi:MAG: radical SAM family heme chaperone HemW [Bacteroidota bacterium]
MASLYLHIPFCEKKCLYCDFYSIENHSMMEEFVQALKKEIILHQEYKQFEKIDTIFFGGGTPSLLSPDSIGDIMQHLHSTFNINSNAEITIEANPGTVDLSKLNAYRSGGINRLSLGVQSFYNDELKFLSRIHSVDDAKQAVRWAQEAKFDSINIDLIFALPGQSLDRWKDNLRQAIDLGTQHISAYSLIVEDNTPLARMVKAKVVSPLPVESEAEMFEFTMDFLAKNGFEHYEVSNYSKPGFACRHNCNYWNHTNYLGFGPSAHSFWTDRRWWNIANVQTYLKQISQGVLPHAGDETLSPSQLFNEKIMLGLRSGGVDIVEIQSEFGIDLLSNEQGLILNQLLSEDMAILEDSTIRLTRQGFLLCDEISARLLPNMIAA